MTAKPMTIAHAAREAGVGVETIRFYERKGIIARPERPGDSGYRIYPRETVARIRMIRQAQRVGFTLAEIAELLTLRADPAADCADVRGRASVKLADVEQKIARLEQIRAALEELIAACPGRGALRHCSIMETLAPTPAKPTRTWRTDDDPT